MAGNGNSRQRSAGEYQPPDLDKWINYVQIAAMGATVVSGWLTGLPWVPIVVLAIVVGTCVYAIFVLRKMGQLSRRSRDVSLQYKLSWTSFIVILCLVFFIAYMANRKGEVLQEDSREGEVIAANASRIYKLPIATIEELKQDRIVGRTVFLLDVLRTVDESQLLGRPPTIRFKTFERCEIRGPALVLANTGTFVNCIFAAPNKDNQDEADEGTFLEVRPGRPLAGSLTVEECLFNECEFFHVTIAGSPTAIKKWRDSVN